MPSIAAACWIFHSTFCKTPWMWRRSSSSRVMVEPVSAGSPFSAVHLGHANVADYYFKGLLATQGDGFFAAGGGGDAVPFVFKG